MIIGIDWLYEVNGVIDFPYNQLIVLHDFESIKVPFQVTDKCVIIKNDSIENFVVTNNKNCPHIVSLVNEANQRNYDFKQKCYNAKLSTEGDKQRLNKLLCNFKDLFSPNPGLTNKYKHVIKLYDYSPFIRKSYPIPFSLREKVDKEINRMLSLGVIKRKSTSYISPILVVRKRDDTVRLCLDARWLIARMVNDCESSVPAEEILYSF